LGDHVVEDRLTSCSPASQRPTRGIGGVRDQHRHDGRFATDERGVDYLRRCHVPWRRYAVVSRLRPPIPGTGRRARAVATDSTARPFPVEPLFSLRMELQTGTESRKTAPCCLPKRVEPPRADQACGYTRSEMPTELTSLRLDPQ
jgi:hypothetical protein